MKVNLYHKHGWRKFGIRCKGTLNDPGSKLTMLLSHREGKFRKTWKVGRSNTRIFLGMDGEVEISRNQNNGANQ